MSAVFSNDQNISTNAFQGGCCISNEMQLQRNHMKKIVSKLGFGTELLVEVVWVTSESTDADRMKNCVTVSTNAFDIESSLNQWSCHFVSLPNACVRVEDIIYRLAALQGPTFIIKGPQGFEEAILQNDARKKFVMQKLKK